MTTTNRDGDRGRSSVRQVNLRDHLWRTFELMSAEQEKPIDELLNDALAAYAQIAGYETTGSRDSSPGFGAVGGASVPVPSGEESKRRAASGPFAGTGGPPAVEPLQRPSSASGIPPMPGPALAPGPGSGPSSAPGIPSGTGPGLRPAPGPIPSRFSRPGPGGGGPPVGAPSAVLPPRPSTAAPPVEAPSTSASPVLFLLFDQQRYRIDKDQFIIGRGSKSSDLPIKDGNISRKHAAVIRRNGTFFIKDLGSTNGIDFKGMRIDNKRIDEGDVFHICEYELKFTYKR